MNWLKDKKNLPIIAGLAAFVLVGAVVFILFQLGVIGGSSGGTEQTASPVVASAPTPATGGPPGTMPLRPGGPPPGTMAPGPGSPQGSRPPGGPPQPMHPKPGMPMGSMPPKVGGPPRPKMPGAPGSMAAAPGMNPGAHPPGPGSPAAGAAVVKADPTIINPHNGPDPFSIPGGALKLKQVREATNPGGLSMPLRNLLPRMNLWNYQPPQPPAPIVDGSNGGPMDPSMPVMRVSGIAQTSDGTFAILEVAGQSQTVKPGDPIPGGGQVLTIQSDGVTVRTSGGQTVTVPLSGGSAGAANSAGSPNFAPAQSMDQPSQ